MCNSLFAPKKPNAAKLCKKRLDISLKKPIGSDLWDNAAECIKGSKPEAKQMNKYISEVRFKLMDCYHPVTNAK